MADAVLRPFGELRQPYRLLFLVFAAWKSLLLAIAAAAGYVGPAYDTSASLLGASTDAVGQSLSMRLTSWDAIYYIEAARRGYVFEQEWAFGSGLPWTVAWVRNGLVSLGAPTGISLSALAIVVSHGAHLLSVFVLYRLGQLVWPGVVGQRTALVAAILHILSPGGLFLSAPYSESAFSLLSFAGHLAYAFGCLQDKTTAVPSFAGDVLRLVAALLYGLASVFRSNGLLNGVLFAYEAVVTTVRMVRQPNGPLFRRAYLLLVGGVVVASGTVVPQIAAYIQFCIEPSGVPGETWRPWCTRSIPSIYGFVQAHYWNTGLFRYWTLSNVPLFLLAAPMLSILAWSTREIWAGMMQQARPAAAGAKQDTRTLAGCPAEPRLIPMVCCLAVTQSILAGLALTSYHVQIITRLCSAYPVWYWWLAQSLAGPQASVAGKIVCFMVMYASIQAVLFASFLPPA